MLLNFIVCSLNYKLICTGFDVETRILFQDERIETYYIDQQDLQKYMGVMTCSKEDWPNLFIDDRLHSPFANINSLLCFMQLSSPNSYLVIEDIPERSEEVWVLVYSLISGAKFTAWMYDSTLRGVAFVVQNN